MKHHCGNSKGQETHPTKPTVADVFRRFGKQYRDIHRLSGEQLKVMSDIETCRTPVLGGYVDRCDHCGKQETGYNSCHNRHCMTCQSLKQARWIEGRKNRLLNTHYFHLVFTLPSELRSIALCNRKAVFDILFRAASQTLLELGANPQKLGGTLGFSAILHSWNRRLMFHPHLHIIVPGGALSCDEQHWIPTDSEFLFHFKVLSKLFRGKFLNMLGKLVEKGALDFAGSCRDFADPHLWKKLIRKLYRTNWHVYAEPTFLGPEHVIEYLGRYTHRVGISNERLISISDQQVVFYTKHGMTCSLPPLEFIRRFLLHVLPKRFVKIRHYGLLAPSNVNTKFETARHLLPCLHASADETVSSDLSDNTADPFFPNWRKLIIKLTGRDPLRCPHCGKGTLLRTSIPRSTGPPDFQFAEAA